MNRISDIAFGIRKWTEGVVIGAIAKVSIFLGREFMVFGSRMRMKAFIKIGAGMLIVPAFLVSKYVSDLPPELGCYDDDGSFTTAGDIGRVAEEATGRIINTLKR